jgi:hypothetical protein
MRFACCNVNINFNYDTLEIFRDLVAPGPQNVWICEVGSSRLNGTFENFLQNIAASGKLDNVKV